MTVIIQYLQCILENILMLQEAQNKMVQPLTNGSTMVEITNNG